MSLIQRLKIFSLNNGVLRFLIGQVSPMSTATAYWKKLKSWASARCEAGRIKIELCGNPPSGQLDGNVVVTTRTEKDVVNSSIKITADILGVVETASY